jgi:hypothetical protein
MKKSINKLIAISGMLIVMSTNVNAQSWSTTGNAGTTTTTNFIGTTDNVNLRFRTKNVNRMTINTSGYVGVGTTTPTSKLEVKDGTVQIRNTTSSAALIINRDNTTPGTSNEILFEESSANKWALGGCNLGSALGSNFSLYNYTTGLNAMTILNSNNNVGIGTTTPAHKLDVAGRMRVQTGNGNAGIWLMDPGNSFDAAFWGIIDINHMGFYGSVLGGWGMSMNLDNGYVGIGTTTASHKLDVYTDNSYAIYGETVQNNANGVSGICNVGSIAYGVYGQSGTGWAGFFSGNVYSSGTYTGSDERLKENIQPVQNALDKVMKLEVKTYNFKSEYNRMNLAKGTQTGFIAQNLETIFPELVKTAADKSDPAAPFEFKAVNYTGMIPVLTAAIQEQQRKIESLEAALSQCCSNYSTQKNDAGSSAVTPDKASLEQNAPNPFSDETTIHFYLPTNSTAVLKVMTLEGQQVLAEQISKSGYGEVRISGSTMAAGTYTYTLIVNGKAFESKIMVLTK